MPDHKKDAEIFAPAPEFGYVGGFEKAVAVVSNLIARATTQWNLEESKLFILAVSQIETRDEECRVKFRKKDVINALRIDPRKTNELRRKLTNVKDKSQVELHGPGASDWEVGNLIIGVKTDRNYVSMQFNPYYLPLLHYVKDRLFTKFEIQNVMGFRHKASYNLYLYLTSWHNHNYLVSARNINKSELSKVFNLKEDQYWRNYGTDKAKFAWHDFEKYCLNPAIEDINSNPFCDMKIDSWMKVKDPRNMKYVLGYAFKWHYVNPDGSYKIKDEKKEISNPEDICTFEDLNHASFFMKHFKRMNDRKLKALSQAMGSVVSPFDWSNTPLEQPAWTVGELKQEQSQEWISLKFYSDLAKIVHENYAYEQFAQLFGYDQDTLEDPAQVFVDDLEGIRAKVGG